MYGLLCLTFLLGTVLRSVGSTPQTSITARAPVKPVKEKEILSLHCKAVDIPKGYVVTVSKNTLNDPEKRVSWDKGVVSGVDDRTYLAVRQLKDGSFVYFLTITDVTKSDEGVYQCQIVKEGSLNVIAAHNVHIPIQYFPSEKPKCVPAELTRYKAGQSLVLNCSSTAGFPVVNISWTRAGSDITYLSKQHTKNGTTYSLLNITLTEKDNDAVFMCVVKSVAFRRGENRCHVGPISVAPNPDFVYNPARDTTLMPPPIITRRPHYPVKVQNVTDDCTEVCQSPPTVKYWILACSAAGALALIFLLSVMILLIKYCQTSKETQPKQRRKSSKHHPTGEEIYTELEYRRDTREARDANKLYMSLQKQQPQNPEQPQPAEEEEPEGRDYGVTTGVPTGTPVVYKSHYV